MQKTPSFLRTTFIACFFGTFLFLTISLPTDANQAAAEGNAPNTPEFTGCGGANVTTVNQEYEQRVVELVNRERAAVGLPPMKRVAGLDASARYHAADLAQDDYFNHDTYDRNGANLEWVCNTWERIKTYYPTPSAENIAAGYGDPEGVMQGWMDSAGHRDNILGGSWEIGSGYYTGGSYGRYWVQNFGKRSGFYPLIIDREASSTDNRQVEIYIYGSWSEMRLKNDEGDWLPWLPFQNSFLWELPPEAGWHVVTAELRAGTSTAISSDEVYLSVDSNSGLARLGGLPGSVRFVYVQESASLFPLQVTIQPENIAGDQSLAWSLSTQSNWLQPFPLQGVTPESFTIKIYQPQSLSVGSYTAQIQLSVIDPIYTKDSPQSIQVELIVVQRMDARNFLPLIQRD